MNTKKEIEPKNIEQIKPVEAQVQPEVESWVEKIERKFARVPNQTVTPLDDTVVVQSPQAQQPPVTLPVNQQQMQMGKRAKTDLGHHQPARQNNWPVDRT